MPFHGAGSHARKYQSMELRESDQVNARRNISQGGGREGGWMGKGRRLRRKSQLKGMRFQFGREGTRTASWMSLADGEITEDI